MPSNGMPGENKGGILGCLAIVFSIVGFVALAAAVNVGVVCRSGNHSLNRPESYLGRRVRLKVNGAEGIIACEPDGNWNDKFWGVRYENKAGEVKEIWVRVQEFELIQSNSN